MRGGGGAARRRGALGGEGGGASRGWVERYLGVTLRTCAVRALMD